jgi:uncharacterized membrane protein YfcA
MTPILALAAVLLAAFIKGAIGFGFPTLGTPLLALFIDVKTAVALLIVPNIVMDAIQFVRGGAPVLTVRRFASLVVFGAFGMVAGTKLLVMLPPGRLLVIMGGFVLLFVVLNVTRFSPRLPPGWEPWMSPVAGFVGGVVGGVTNVPGTLVIIYFYSLRLAKAEFVSSVAFSFFVYKLVQLGSMAWFGLFTWPVLGASAALALAGLGGFALGLRVQDRLEQQAFNRVVLGFLALLGAWLVIRGG